MLRILKLVVVCASVYTMWVAPGSAFQLLNDSTDTLPVGSSPLRTIEDKPNLDGTPLDLGDSSKSAPSQDKGLSIWIPGIGKVGTMPKLDFGLEMLYGSEGPSKDHLGGARDLEEFDSDFSIKGTIKRKF